MAWPAVSPKRPLPARSRASTTPSRSISASAWSPARCTKPQRWRSDMSTAAPEPKANMGQPVPRYDAVAKVTGRARYAADVPLANPAFAYLVTSAIAKGRIDSFDLTEAKNVRGVIDIVTHENAEKLKDAKLFSNGGYTSTTIQPWKSADIAHDGEIIAVVVAQTFEAAREAARRVRVSYSEDKP